MRTFLSACWLITLFAGSYLALWAPPFEMPDRFHPGCGWLLTPPLSRTVGGALLLIAWAGWRLIRRARAGTLATAPYRWHRTQWLLMTAALSTLIAASAITPYGALEHTLVKTACPVPAWGRLPHKTERTG